MIQGYTSPALHIMNVSAEEGFAQSGKSFESKMLTDWTVEEVEW